MNEGRKQITGIAAKQCGAKRNAGKTVMLEIECPIGKQQAAEILGISVDTLDQWTVRCGIPHYKYDMDGNRGNRGKVAYLASDILEFRERFKVERRDIEREVEKTMAEADG